MNIIRKSIPKRKVVHGIEVKKLPLGAFLDMLETLKYLPEDLLKKLFPDKTAEEAISELKFLRYDNFFGIFSRTISVLPGECVDVFSQFLNVPSSVLKEKLTPSQFFDVAEAFWELNDMENFIKKAKGAVIHLTSLSH